MKRFFVNNNDEALIKQVKALYDLADTIKEKRYDKKFVGLNTESNLDRIAELDKLLLAAKECRKRENLELLILADITIGNICLNLSTCYLNVFQYERARECAQTGREYLWEALQEVKNLENPEPCLHFLIRLNMAKYYWEWAALTRRSNYDFAKHELQVVLEGVESIQKEQSEMTY